jgi:hypothetical protein
MLENQKIVLLLFTVVPVFLVSVVGVIILTVLDSKFNFVGKYSLALYFVEMNANPDSDPYPAKLCRLDRIQIQNTV